MILGFLASCGGEPRRPNVLIITLDTVRADHFGVYGYTRNDATPRLDEFAKECILFERAFSNSSFTPPSHASLFTSLYPSEHGLMHWQNRLGDATTASEMFAAAGYRTAAFSPMRILLDLGLSRGFDEVHVPTEEISGYDVLMAEARGINALARPYLTNLEKPPFFAWVHYFDAHRPYGWMDPEVARRFNDWEDLSIGTNLEHYGIDAQRRDELGLDSDEIQFIKDRYDGGLAYLDENLGKMLEAMRAAGTLDETIVVITADHGEVLDEYDEWFSHDAYLFDENVHVPLMIRLPGARFAGKRVDALVQGVDVLPTILELAGVSSGGALLSGRSTVPAIEGSARINDYVFADRIGKDISQTGVSPEAVARRLDRKRMVRTETHKLIHYVHRDSFELYDLNDETTDLFSLDDPLSQELLQLYADHIRGLQPSGDASDSDLDEETELLLQSLGYL